MAFSPNADIECCKFAFVDFRRRTSPQFALRIKPRRTINRMEYMPVRYWFLATLNSMNKVCSFGASNLIVFWLLGALLLTLCLDSNSRDRSAFPAGAEHTRSMADIQWLCIANNSAFLRKKGPPQCRRSCKEKAYTGRPRVAVLRHLLAREGGVSCEKFWGGARAHPGGRDFEQQIGRIHAKSSKVNAFGSHLLF